MSWMNWREFRTMLRAWGLSKRLSGRVCCDIIDGVVFELTWNGETRRFVSENWMVRAA